MGHGPFFHIGFLQAKPRRFRRRFSYSLPAVYILCRTHGPGCGAGYPVQTTGFKALGGPGQSAPPIQSQFNGKFYGGFLPRTAANAAMTGSALLRIFIERMLGSTRPREEDGHIGPLLQKSIFGADVPLWAMSII